MNLQKLKDWHNSEEGKKSISDYASNLKREEEIRNSQLERLYKSGKFIEFTEKVIFKYSTPKYYTKWYKLGIDPPEDLSWFLFDYAIKYGRECTKEEWNKYSNDFTSELYYHQSYYFNQMSGQGAYIKIIKES